MTRSCGFDLLELQADEIRTFIGRKDRAIWIFATIEVSSRLWPTSVIGRRIHESARNVIAEALNRGTVGNRLLVTTDGLRCYPDVAWRLLGPRCV